MEWTYYSFEAKAISREVLLCNNTPGSICITSKKSHTPTQELHCTTKEALLIIQDGGGATEVYKRETLNDLNCPYS